MTALPPPKNPKAGELAFTGLSIGAVYALASITPCVMLGLPIFSIVAFPAIGFVIGDFLDQRPAA